MVNGVNHLTDSAMPRGAVAARRAIVNQKKALSW